jgi:hypothetical protein
MGNAFCFSRQAETDEKILKLQKIRMQYVETLKDEGKFNHECSFFWVSTWERSKMRKKSRRKQLLLGEIYEI